MHKPGPNSKVKHILQAKKNKLRQAKDICHYICDNKSSPNSDISDVSSLCYGCYSDVNALLDLLAEQSQSRKHDLLQFGRKEITKCLDHLSQPLMSHNSTSSYRDYSTIIMWI